MAIARYHRHSLRVLGYPNRGLRSPEKGQGEVMMHKHVVGPRPLAVFVVPLCAVATMLAGCQTLQSSAWVRERKVCELNPALCPNGQLMAQTLAPVTVAPDRVPLPDLVVVDVGCDPYIGAVWSAHISRMQGLYPFLCSPVHHRPFLSMY